ncbi:uncharacterized protein PODANS_6_5762 [Podospora anserina S mat+]|uniref:Podospora anserina S mat+ genomic DNA chromosome 6, supercontig 2 n=1 Tax=Podospora anserina (strain S / ATCC MYA-4624 / DSM 980 / FGSC 10383) TaxID=515849 RepID=B2B272_PODAN|nr:uncharacterized protein PODANS_6_5762 [Podospora anserina S mat+]CAP71207.1 unnamed protein product [Podospora anserina S mat+]
MTRPDGPGRVDNVDGTDEPTPIDGDDGCENIDDLTDLEAEKERDEEQKRKAEEEDKKKEEEKKDEEKNDSFLFGQTKEVPLFFPWRQESCRVSKDSAPKFKKWVENLESNEPLVVRRGRT